MTAWFRDWIPSYTILKETEHAVLFRIPQSGYAGYTFWFPKKFMCKPLNKTTDNPSNQLNKFRKVFYPETLHVTISNGKESIPILAGVAFSAIRTPQFHPYRKESREIKDLIGY